MWLSRDTLQELPGGTEGNFSQGSRDANKEQESRALPLHQPSAVRPGFDFLQGQKMFLYSITPRPDLWPTQPPIQWVPGAFPWHLENLLEVSKIDLNLCNCSITFYMMSCHVNKFPADLILNLK
jgi:hypothetical protein